MSVRETLNNNPALVTIGAIVLLIVCLGLVIWQLTGSGGGRQIDYMYYYDLNTGKVFTADSTKFPPIDTPSGTNQGVQARIYSCSECASDYSGMTPDEVKNHNGFIGYLSKYPPEAKQALLKDLPPEKMEQQYELWNLVKPVDGGKWIEARKEQGSDFTNSMYKHCPKGANPEPCYPNS